MATIKLGELLRKANLLQEPQLKAALAEQQKWGGRLGDILVRMRLVTEDVLVKALSRQMGIPAANLDAVQGLPPHVKAKVPADKARDLSVLPLALRDDGRTLVVAMAEPQNVQALDTLRAIANCRIVPQLAGRTAIGRAIARIYEGEAELEDFEGSFKVVDAQGRTVVRSMQQVAAEAGKKVPEPSPEPAAAAASASPLALLEGLEEAQRKEVAAIKAMVELLIERGVFTRDEYLAKVRR